MSTITLKNEAESKLCINNWFLHAIRSIDRHRIKIYQEIWLFHELEQKGKLKSFC